MSKNIRTAESSLQISEECWAGIAVSYSIYECGNIQQYKKHISEMQMVWRLELFLFQLVKLHMWPEVPWARAY